MTHTHTHHTTNTRDQHNEVVGCTPVAAAIGIVCHLLYLHLIWLRPQTFDLLIHT